MVVFFISSILMVIIIISAQQHIEFTFVVMVGMIFLSEHKPWSRLACSLAGVKRLIGKVEEGERGVGLGLGLGVVFGVKPV